MGRGSFNEEETPPYFIFEDKEIRMIKTGYSHSLILKKNGDLYGAGYNSFSQLGIGDKTNKNTFVFILNDKEIAKMECGLNFNLILRKNGDLLGFCFFKIIFKRKI